MSSPWAFAGGILGGLGLDLITTPITSGLDPLAYRSRMAAWRAWPGKLLELQDYVKLFNYGWLTSDNLEPVFNSYGYEFSPVFRSWYKLFDTERATGKLTMSPMYHRRDMGLLNKLLQVSKRTLTNDETLNLLNRRFITEYAAKQIITMNSDGERDLADAILRTKDLIPGMSDLIHFAVKEAFNKEVIEAMGYNKEFPEYLLPFMAQLGYGWETGFDMPAGSTNTSGPDPRTKATWLDHYWWAHWDNLSPTQWFECLHRFYPVSPRGPAPEVTARNQTVRADVELALKIQDYPEPLRARLIDTSYSPLTRVDVRRMYDVGTLDDNGVYHAYRAIGYSDENAERLLDFTKKLKQGKEFTPIKAQVIRTADKQARLGIIDRVGFAALLAGVGISQEEADIRWTSQTANEFALASERLIKKIRVWFLNGTFDEGQARVALGQIPVLVEAIDNYLATWKIERAFGSKFISGEKAVGLYKKRLVSEQQLFSKLTNLGYTNSEASLIIQEAKYDVVSIQRREAEKSQKDALKQREKEESATRKAADLVEKEREKQQGRIISAKEKELAKALSAFSQPNIIAWYKGGAISEEQITTVLRLKGWKEASITAFKRVQLGISSEGEGEQSE